jgi:SAM-dependent methyltransferase
MKTLEQIFVKYCSSDGGGDKGSLHSYIEVYSREMKKTRDVDLLEVGVWEGHSLAMWGEYLKRSRVIGVDVDLSRCKFDVDARLCDGTNAEALQTVLGDASFDYVIDDGSHRVEHQVKSFEVLWERVKPGGVYFIEDIDGDEALTKIAEAIAQIGIEFTVYDLRTKKARWDDIMVVARRGQ